MLYQSCFLAYGPLLTLLKIIGPTDWPVRRTSGINPGFIFAEPLGGSKILGKVDPPTTEVSCQDPPSCFRLVGLFAGFAFASSLELRWTFGIPFSLNSPECRKHR